MNQVGFIVTFSFSRHEDQGTVNKIVKYLRHAYYVVETTLSDGVITIQIKSTCNPAS